MASLIVSFILAFPAAFFIFKIIEEITSVSICDCGHEFNQHIVYPHGMINPVGSEKCKKCNCKNFKEKTSSNLFSRWDEEDKKKK